MDNQLNLKRPFTIGPLGPRSCCRRGANPCGAMAQAVPRVGRPASPHHAYSCSGLGEGKLPVRLEAAEFLALQTLTKAGNKETRMTSAMT